MVTYAPGTAKIFETVPGGITLATDIELELWRYALLEGTVKGNGIVISNAGIEIIQIIDTISTVIGIVFTNKDGLYKTSIRVVENASYKINVYSPIG